jgi:hypothetical protein
MDSRATSSRLLDRVIAHSKRGTLFVSLFRRVGHTLYYGRRGNVKMPRRAFIHGHDLLNRARFGREAPRYAERIWICPAKCYVATRYFKGDPLFSSRVIDEWPYDRHELYPASDVERVETAIPLVAIVKSCVGHWLKGQPWEIAHDYKQLKEQILGGKTVLGCASVDDLNKRYATLDAIFEDVKAEGRIRVRDEIDQGAFRESDASLIHVGPEGELVLAGEGLHRFSMALVLGLPVMPAQIGCVHRKAIPLLAQLRNPGGHGE